MTRKIARSEPEDTFDDELLHEEPRACDPIKNVRYPLRRFSHGYPLSYGRRALDADDDSESSPEPEERRKPREIDNAHWRKKAALKGRSLPGSNLGGFSTEDHPSSPHEDSAYVYPCPLRVLDSMLEQMKEHNPARYGEYLERGLDLNTALAGLLREEALAVFEKGTFDLDSLLSIGGTIPTGSAIYLHLLWNEDKSVLYLYVGQSQEAIIRIQHHNDPAFRKRHPSLHYHVWEKLGPNAGSAWVILSAPEVVVEPLTLTCLEMWSALVLQTLTRNTLTRYLPNETLGPRVGCHLNLASPLNQGIPLTGLEQDGLGDLYNSKDPFVREHYQERKEEWHELKYSKDPIVYEYWTDSRRRGRATRTKNRREKNRKAALEGTNLKVHKSQTIYLCGQTVHIGYLIVKLDISKPLFVQCVLSNKPDSARYALDSGPDDDASRLVIYIRGTTDEGKTFQGTVHSYGEKIAEKLNFIYDVLVGRSLEESLKLPRRPRQTEKAT